MSATWGVPPANAVQPGRFNDPGSPVLYLSLSQFSALVEVDAQPDSFVQLISYAFAPSEKLTCGILGEITQVQRWGNALLSSDLGKSVNAILNKLSPEAGRSFVYTDAFLSELMRDRLASESQYVHSRTLANLLFRKYSFLDAIMYPGIKLEGAMNFAVRPTSANRVLYPNGSAVVHVQKKYNYGFF